MKAKLVKLIDVKSIVTILMTIVFSLMSWKGIVSSEQFVTIFTTVIAFYFGTQQNKSNDE